MDITFTELMRVIAVLSCKERNKEETLAYHDFLRYARSIARVNEDQINKELYRRQLAGD